MQVVYEFVPQRNKGQAITRGRRVLLRQDGRFEVRRFEAGNTGTEYGRILGIYRKRSNAVSKCEE